MSIAWKDEKILVTGGSGFLGANLIRLLVREKGAPPGSILSLSHRHTHALDDLPDVEQRFGDIADETIVRKACSGRTIVFHTAGATTFDPRLRKEQWRVNVEGTRTVLDAVRSSRTVRRVCHTSTVNVLGFPWPDGSVGTEECSPYAARPRLHSCASAAEVVALADGVHYGRAPRGWWKRIRVGYFDSKLAAQELVNRAVREGLDAVSVLPGTFFGPGDELLGPAQYVLAVLRGALPGVPRGGLPLTHVHDVAVGHTLAVEKGARGATYIVSGQPEDNRRFADMMRIIAEVLREKEPGRPIRSEFPVVPYAIAWIAAGLAEGWAFASGRAPAVSRQAVRASRRGSFYSSQLAASTLGYKPEKCFREGVAEMYDYLKAHGALAGPR